MGDVVNLHESEPRIWTCGCGCRSFRLYEDGGARCGNCDVTASAGTWTFEAKEAAPAREPFSVIDVSDPTPDHTIRSALKSAAEIVVAIFIYRSGRQVTWSNIGRDDKQRQDWARPRLNDAVADILKESTDGTR